MADAERHNQGKPQLSYMLSFPDDQPNDWAGTFDDAVSELAAWYRGEHDDFGMVVEEFYEAAMLESGKTIPALVAAVCEFGASKYARGNYLLGRSWSDTCDSLLRHVVALASGSEYRDPESGCDHVGHILWNVLYLGYCIRTRPDLDDRLRPPNEAPREDQSEATNPVSPVLGAGWRNHGNPDAWYHDSGCIERLSSGRWKWCSYGVSIPSGAGVEETLAEAQSRVEVYARDGGA